MNIFISLYNEVLYIPLFNGLVWLYITLPWHDMGLAIVVFTVIIRLILAPLLWKAQKSQKDWAKLQPEIKKIQAEFKNNREAQGRATMELSAKHKVNPFSGCLIMLVQFPILIALFQLFRKGFDPSQLQYLYSFISSPGALEPISFGFLNLAKGNIYLGVMAALTQYFQTKMTFIEPAAAIGGKNDFSKILRWQTLYFFPALILFWSATMPSALTLYWTILNIVGILQEIVMRKFKGGK